MSYIGEKIENRADRFLFDCGYTRGLLSRAQDLLKYAAEEELGDTQAAEARALVDDIKEFLEAQGKLYRDELYAAGEAAATKVEKAVEKGRK